MQLSGNDTMVFGCFYRSPTSNPDSIKNNEHLNSLKKDLSSNKKYSHRCFVGDFNFRTIDWSGWSSPHGEESKEEKFLEAVRDSFLFQHIQEPTRCRGTDDPSVIDLIFSCEEDQISNLNYIAPLGKSDHSVLSFNFNCYTNCKGPSKRYVYDSGNFLAMRQLLDEQSWSLNFAIESGGKSVDSLWDTFKIKLLDLRDRYVPLKEIGQPSWKDKGNIPIKQELRNLIKEKKRLHRNWLKSRNEKTRTNQRAKYIKARNKVKRIMTQEKRNFERDICNRSRENPKVFWSHVRRNLKTKSDVAPLLESNSKEASLKFNDKDKANILQSQFCGVFTNEPHGDIPYFELKTNNTINDIHVTVDMVKKAIQGLNPTKAFGPDEISPRMLKELVDYLSDPLAIIMNKTLSDSCLPADWKMAHVTPIFKKGVKNLPENYRPVSLTSICCKLTESIIKDQMMSYLLQENLLSNKQYGFIGKRSTTTQLLTYIDKCCEVIANGSVVDCIYFDFAKAFDTVPHRRLLKKLECYGIKGKIVQWIKAFLSDRHQLVKINGAHSRIGSVISGIPQGSVLGPLLFVLYINDLPEEIISEIFLFADDTKIFKRVDSVDDSDILQRDIATLEEWSRDWLLKFHPDKCHVLTIGKFDNIKHAHPYTLHGNVLEHVFQEKDIGLIVDSELSFEQHISEKVMKANKIVGLIRRSFSYLSPKLFRQLFIAFVRPHLEYVQAVWSPKLLKYVRLVESVQRRATKLIDGFRYFTYQERLRRLELPSLEFRRMMCDMIEVYKHLNFYDRSTIPNKLVLRTRPNRKHNLQILPNFSKDGVRGAQTKSFYYRCVPTWNNLPSTVVTAPTISVFKNRLNEAWNNHPLKYDC